MSGESGLARATCVKCRQLRFCQDGWCQQSICSDCLQGHFEECQFCKTATFAVKPAKVAR